MLKSSSVRLNFTNNNMRLSIIIPAYNVEQYLEQCVDSCENQDIPHEDYEIIIINDGSKDKTLAVAYRLASRYDNVIVKTQDNQGQAVARNSGMDIAKGRYVLFIDSDDYMESNVLRLMTDTADDNDTEILISSLKIFKADGTYSLSNDLACYNQNMTGTEALFKGLNIGSACARLYKRDFLLKNNLFFETGMKHEDVYFNMKAYTLVSAIRSLDLCTYVYRWNEGSTDRSFDSQSITKGLLADLKIARLEKDYSENTNCKISLRTLFSKKSNSLVVSIFLSFYRRNKDLPELNKEEVKNYAIRHNLFPIKGSSLTWKSTIISIILNFVISNKFFSKMVELLKSNNC